MATPYTGDPTATQTPAPEPGSAAVPIVNLPDDGDDLDAASVAQEMKTSADYIAYLTTRPWTEFEATWSGDTTSITTSTTPLVADSRFAYAQATGGTFACAPPDSNNYLGSLASIAVTASGGSQSRIRTINQILRVSIDANIVLEFDIGLGANTYGLTFIGLQDHTATFSSGTGSYLGIVRAGADPTWYGDCRNGATASSTDSNVTASTTAGAQRVRIEYHGSATSIGNGTNRIQYYFDDVLSVTQTTNVPVSTNMYFAASIVGDAAGVNEIDLGRVLCRWNARP